VWGPAGQLVTVGAHDVTVMTDVVRTVEVVYTVVELEELVTVPEALDVGVRVEMVELFPVGVYVEDTPVLVLVCVCTKEPEGLCVKEPL